MEHMYYCPHCKKELHYVDWLAMNEFDNGNDYRIVIGWKGDCVYCHKSYMWNSIYMPEKEGEMEEVEW